jgi:phage terminase large subunit-like protein
MANPTKTPDEVAAYARAVVDGAVPAGKWHRLTCERHLRDLDRQGTPDFPYVFNASKALRFFRFAERLKHYKGQWAGQCIKLEPWQKFITGSLFGWVHKDTGLRRFRTAFTQVPRKNGKTLIAAIVILYVTFFDGESGAEGYFIATKRDQAKIAFADAKQLVNSSGLKTRVSVQVGNLHRKDTVSKLEPLGADHDSTDGLNPNAVGVDELHAMKDRGMLDVMETATGARAQPVMYEITTFGDDPVSVWGDQYDYACKILDRVLVDETFLTFSAHADLDDDWTSIETAKKANPNFGISVNPEDLASKIAKAKGIPAAAAAYKQKHLNILTNATAPCLSVDGWRAGQSKWEESDMRGQECYVGVDLASKIDLCALSFLFPPRGDRKSWRVIQRLWTPRDTVIDRAHRDRAPYAVWAEQTWLTLADGKSIDHDLVRQALLAHRKVFKILQIGFDPWHADTPIKNLITLDGFSESEVIEVPQTYAGMSAGCLAIQADVLSGLIDARGCPVTAWSVSNTVSQSDGKDNLMFVKKKSRGRIDPVIAFTIARSLALRREQHRKRTPFVAFA